jgi:hypothetical protein
MKKNLKELMHSRSPISKRDIVKSVDLYDSKQNDNTSNIQANKPTKPQIVKYTTHLTPEIIKTIKLYAVEHNIKDYEVLTMSLEKFFKSDIEEPKETSENKNQNNCL